MESLKQISCRYLQYNKFKSLDKTYVIVGSFATNMTLDNSRRHDQDLNLIQFTYLIYLSYVFISFLFLIWYESTFTNLIFKLI